ncbi:MAG: hypothetical protein JSS81_11855 [Acidobacteria bacterium]|nr:hypothetical protein [Acidobacteriota bacterium]
MNNLFKLENVVAVVYALVFGAALFALFFLRVSDRLAMPVAVGLFGILGFVIYLRPAQRISQRYSALFVALNALLVILFFIPGLTFSVCLPLPLLIVFMLLIRRERSTAMEQWLKTKNFSPVANPPAEILEKLGPDRNWRCFANSFHPPGSREVPYLAWFGFLRTNITTMVNGAPVQTVGLISQVAVSFFPGTVGENFKQMIESRAADRQSFWKNLRPSSAQLYPYQVERFPDGSFAAAWSIEHIPLLLDEKWHELESLLAASDS